MYYYFIVLLLYKLFRIIITVCSLRNTVYCDSTASFTFSTSFSFRRYFFIPDSYKLIVLSKISFRFSLVSRRIEPLPPQSSFWTFICLLYLHPWCHTSLDPDGFFHTRYSCLYVFVKCRTRSKSVNMYKWNDSLITVESWQ